MSERGQKVLIWWALSFTAIYGLTLFSLLRMMPPPSATWSADRIAAFHVESGAQIKIGATVASWTSAFLVPLAIVVVSMTPNSVVHSPFPRWFGYFTAWVALVFEAGAIAFLTPTRPFAWNVPQPVPA